ncbi:ADP-ribosyl-[dinitrogen reductase] hydrolase [Clostridium sp. P21]|uniref:ADP-ribosyl-[dinitrogen reductase] hydrolase n=1 Tax=Clostridium muellerianum TaxID=2716538 RepID=A0A7Y0HME3_9CLOT|nr:ADP-ribosylglycohydrolase family protein [Clostridium muellerianum]NMM62894.1 ADP-ribosyl-[dinitrogen reductase] hydrolase [Clostridium muellerianum]
MKKEARILGGLFGVACGDALGGTLEFLSKREGKEEYGYLKEIVGGGVWNLKPGEVTDDTMMTIAVACGILQNPKDPLKNIGENFIDWYDGNPKDVGNTVKLAMEGYKRYNSWKKAATYAHKQLDGHTAGNGTLMRCIPAALYYDDLKKIIKVSREQSMLTHYDEKAAEACELYNTIVYRYMNGEEKMKVIEEETTKYQDYEDITSTAKIELNPSGYVVDTLQCALWCFINNGNSEDVICEAVNLYGDPDTIGAIAGGLAGVYYGINDIPERWREKILVKDKLKEIAKKMQEKAIKKDSL